MSEAPTFWDTRYAREDYIFGEAPNAFVARQAARLKAGWRALAVGDGEGRNGVWLAEQGLSVQSVDSSRVAQAKALALAERRGVTLELRLADLTKWFWPEDTFDAVVAIFVQFASASERVRMFAGMQRALKPGGLLLLEGYRPEQIAYGTGGPSAVENLYTEALLRDAFGAMEIIELSAYDAAIHEGVAHNGMSALIDLVARRRD